MIIEIKPEHCHPLAELHLAYLNSPFQSKPGIELLKRYYQAVCKGQGAFGYVAQSENEILGYVCGVWDATYLKNILIKQSGIQLAFWSLLQVVAKPFLLTDFLARFRKATSTPPKDEGGYELRPIVVAPASRGTGLATELVETLLGDAARRGYSKIHLYTEEDNRSANKFYLKFGFDCVRQETRSEQVYCRYEYPTEGVHERR